MCEMCREPGGMASCPNCGKLVCWDIEQGDDVIGPAAATMSGDFMCLDCAIRHDREAERQYEEWDDHWEPPSN